MVTLSVETIEEILLETTTGALVSLDAETYIVVPPESYTGGYEYTPSSLEQVISIAGKTAVQDIVINPIPSNYGLITWDGSTLTVS